MLKPVGALTGHAESLELMPEQFSVSSDLFTLFLPGHDCSSIPQLEGSEMLCCSLSLRKSLLLLSAAPFMALLFLGFSSSIQSTGHAPVGALWNVQVREMSWHLSS